MTRVIEELVPGTLFRVGARENAASKAARYLISGRVQIRSVTPTEVIADVRGGGFLWRVEYSDGWWRCTCPARSKCSHLVAVEQVVVVES